MSMLRKRVILFLSTGDTCRSPMAAIYLKDLLEQHGVTNIEVKTAGVSTIVGLLASQETIQVMKANDLDASKHRSNQLSPVGLKRATIVFGMTPYHVQRAVRMQPESKHKIHLLKEFTKSDLEKIQVDDPMGGTLEIYRKCFEEIQEAIDKMVYQPQAIGRELKPEDRKPKPPPPVEEKPEEAKQPAEEKPKAAKKPAEEKAKPAEKKPAEKKPAAKKAPEKKPAAKKPATKKAVAKKPVKKAAAKTTAKKAATKKPAAKKAAKKTTAKKPAKKAATKKPAKKKPAAKKS